MLSFTLDTARTMSLWTVAGAILLALAAVWLVKQVVTKVLTVVILLAIAGLVWSQRAELTDCADNVQASIAQALADDTTCTFFGRDVTLPGRDRLLGDDPASGVTPVTTLPS